MSLHEFSFDASTIAIPTDVVALMTEVDTRIDAYLSQDIKKRAPRYVPSNADEAYQAFALIQRDGLAEGTRFCEWGSGFGMITALAAALGFDATGIEIVDALHRESVSLANDLGISATFVCENFIPNGFEYSENGTGEAGALTNSALLPSQEQDREAYFENDYPIEEFDIIFCYPWPGEAALVEDLFDATASDGTLLVTYCETDRIRIRLKE